MILAIDPGSSQSGFVLYDPAERCIIDKGKTDNAELLACLHDDRAFDGATTLAIEMIASYGMAVGAEVFETCVWIGRYLEAWTSARGLPATRVYRNDVKLHLCGQPRAKDANIRAALIDLWGGKDVAIGKKASRGPLYGVAGDEWAALGVAVTFAETKLEGLT